MLPLLLCDWSWNCHVVCESVNIACLAFSLLGVHDNIYISLHWSTWISSPLPASSLLFLLSRRVLCSHLSLWSLLILFSFFFHGGCSLKGKENVLTVRFYLCYCCCLLLLSFFFLNSGGLSRLTRASWLLSDHSATAIGDVTRLVPASRLVPSTTSKASTSSRSSSTARAFFPRGKHYHLPPHLAPYDRLKGEFPSAPTSRFVLLTCHHALAACAGGTLWGGLSCSRSWSCAMRLHSRLDFSGRLCGSHEVCLHAFHPHTHTAPTSCLVFDNVTQKCAAVSVTPDSPPRTHSIARLHSSLLFLCLHGWKPKTCTVNFTMFKRSEYSSWSNWLYVKWTLY